MFCKFSPSCQFFCAGGLDNACTIFKMTSFDDDEVCRASSHKNPRRFSIEGCELHKHSRFPSTGWSKHSAQEHVRGPHRICFGGAMARRSRTFAHTSLFTFLP
jgi:hypothetical protein